MVVGQAGYGQGLIVIFGGKADQAVLPGGGLGAEGKRQVIFLGGVASPDDQGYGGGFQNCLYRDGCFLRGGISPIRVKALESETDQIGAVFFLALLSPGGGIAENIGVWLFQYIRPILGIIVHDIKSQCRAIRNIAFKMEKRESIFSSNGNG